VLVTKNARHFLHDTAVSFHSTHGVIALEGDLRDLRSYAAVLDHLTDIVPYAEIYRGCKIRLSRERLVARLRADDGSIVTYHVRYDEDGRASVLTND
jgi:hypothetical protein